MQRSSNIGWAGACRGEPKALGAASHDQQHHFWWYHFRAPSLPTSAPALTDRELAAPVDDVTLWGLAATEQTHLKATASTATAGYLCVMKHDVDGEDGGLGSQI